MITKVFRLRLGRRTKEPIEGQNRSRWVDLQVNARIRVDIDAEAIAMALGYKALNNRSGRSRGLNGAVVVQATEATDG